MHQNCSETWCSTKEMGTIEAQTIVGFVSRTNYFTKPSCWGWTDSAGTWAAAGSTAALSLKSGAHHCAQQPQGHRGVCRFPPGPKLGRWCPRAHILCSSFPLIDTQNRGRARPYPHPKDLLRHKDTLGHQPGTHWVLAHHFGGWESLSQALFSWRKRKWESAVNRCDSKWELALRVSAWTLICETKWSVQDGLGQLPFGKSQAEPPWIITAHHSAPVAQGIAQPRGR